MREATATWQCVLIAWGDRYPVAEINRLVQQVRRHAHGLKRFVLLSDRPRPGLEPGVELRDIPEWFLQPEMRQSGCQAKLCLFEPGVVPDDMPAIFLDLDTLVFGDLSRLLKVMEGPETIAILQSAVLPFGAFARWLKSDLPMPCVLTHSLCMAGWYICLMERFPFRLMARKVSTSTRFHAAN